MRLTDILKLPLVRRLLTPRASGDDSPPRDPAPGGESLEDAIRKHFSNPSGPDLALLRAIGDDDAEAAIRERFPSAGDLRMLRRSTYITFSDGTFVYKIPFSGAAVGFYRHEARIAGLLPIEDRVEFPRIELHDGDIPVQRYRCIPGRTLMETSRRPGSPFLHIPPGVPALLGRAVSAIHACVPDADLRRVLENRRNDVIKRYRRIFERQAKLGNIARDDADRSAAILSSMSEAEPVLCHGDLNLNNVAVLPDFDSNGKIGIIDFGNAIWGGAREFDFATLRLFMKTFSNREPLFDGIVAAYQEHCGRELDVGLLESFTSLLLSMRRVRKLRRD